MSQHKCNKKHHWKPNVISQSIREGEIEAKLMSTCYLCCLKLTPLMKGLLNKKHSEEGVWGDMLTLKSFGISYDSCQRLERRKSYLLHKRHNCFHVCSKKKLCSVLGDFFSPTPRPHVSSQQALKMRNIFIIVKISLTLLQSWCHALRSNTWSKAVKNRKPGLLWCSCG